MRAHNFSAGPAVLPLSVIEQLQSALPEFRNTQLGLMEMSHRSGDFQSIHDSAKDKLRSLLQIPEDYQVLFLQGGASLQFYMVPLNLLEASESAAYINTGTWSTKAVKEAKRCSQSFDCWAPSDGIFNTIPTEQVDVKDAKYLHYTSNNTIYGTQFHHIPKQDGIPLVVDMSSDICSRPIDVSKYDVIYAGAQKNLGPSGVTAVILSPWAVEQSRKNQRDGGLPSMLNYGLMVDKDSMFNTPNTFGIFALDTMLSWLQDIGGVEAIAIQNEQKAQKIYDEIDNSPLWKPHAESHCRSWMNITWRANDESLEQIFIREADKEGLKGLKGHRSVGGIRASIYNACPVESVDTLLNFMKDFSKNYG